MTPERIQELALQSAQEQGLRVHRFADGRFEVLGLGDKSSRLMQSFMTKLIVETVFENKEGRPPTQEESVQLHAEMTRLEKKHGHGPDCPISKYPNAPGGGSCSCEGVAR